MLSLLVKLWFRNSARKMGGSGRRQILSRLHFLSSGAFNFWSTGQMKPTPPWNLAMGLRTGWEMWLGHTPSPSRAGLGPDHIGPSCSPLSSPWPDGAPTGSGPWRDWDQPIWPVIQKGWASLLKSRYITAIALLPFTKLATTKSVLDCFPRKKANENTTAFSPVCPQ